MKLTVKVQNKSFDVEIADTHAVPMIVCVDGTDFTVYTDSAVESVKKVTVPAVVAQVGAAVIKAPIPGVIQEVNVKEGQAVKKGQVLFVLEAMKMKNNIVANKDGIAATVSVSKGDSVTHGQVLMSYAG